MVMQVGADPGETVPHGDAMALEFCRIPDAGEHEEFRRVDGPGGQDDLASSMNS